ncbi:hypothetical protein PV10_03330 [Exophiala mesophila]|uniref:Rhodopsin domain-containing protein n=1 Tax=Exophiala mesophila TaxID=212818 RepID=A0A0D2A9R6_EXOME|nr:uncharacterized protein PV10_03330 [Exophiala mesophila]KIV95708.1 hypothetical protein PV10_03330 [Exophiala mesophila]
MAITPTTSWAKANLAMAITFIPLTWLVVTMRFIARRKIKAVGTDDWLMLAGLIAYTWYCQTVITAVFYGLGEPDASLTVQLRQDGRKWVWIGEMSYLITIIPVKVSIAAGLLRIAIQRRHRYSLYFIAILSTCASLATIILRLVWCKPVEATWGSPGSCGSISTRIDTGYFMSAVIIFTDWSCAILPVVMLWGLQMKLKVKISVIILLSLGVFASCLTIVRLVFVIHHDFTVNYLVGMSAISIWGVIELGIGIIAGSMVTLRPLLRHITCLSNDSSNSDLKPQDQVTPYRPAPYLPKVARTNNPGYRVEDNDEEEDSSEGGGQKHTLKEMLAMTRVSSRSEC